MQEVIGSLGVLGAVDETEGGVAIEVVVARADDAILGREVGGGE